MCKAIACLLFWNTLPKMDMFFLADVLDISFNWQVWVVYVFCLYFLTLCSLCFYL